MALTGCAGPTVIYASNPSDVVPETSIESSGGTIESGLAPAPDPIMTSSSPDIIGQKLAAEALYACMADAGLPAFIEDLADGQAMAGVDFLHLDTVKWHAPGGDEGEVADGLYYGALEGTSPEASASSDEDYLLIINGIDHSATFQACYESSGYYKPVEIVDPREELRIKNGVVSATNEWVACARANGYPALTDLPAPVADSWETYPDRVLLPTSVSEEAVRSLVASCPISKGSADADPDAILPDGEQRPELYEPLVGIALSGNGETPYQMLSDSERAHYDLLGAILYGSEGAIS